MPALEGQAKMRRRLSHQLQFGVGLTSPMVMDVRNHDTLQ
jgi:hypothetical protein